MLGTETVQVAGDLVRDGNGNTSKVPDLGRIPNCRVEQLSSAELAERGRAGTDDAIRVFLPITSGISSRTVLKLVDRGNEKYKVDGNPLPEIDPEDPELSGYDITATRKVG
ncbi:hypothetical protein [Williamsia sp.]|uniref:hypothetical protein n=1 Tax=Williamsia sp. TaxID=1872085 RepID=UPI002F9334B2